MSTYPQTLTRQELEERLPHRFENFLLDSAILMGDDTHLEATLSLTILENDPDHRELFSRRLSTGVRTMIAPIYMEIMALVSIARIGPTEGHTFVFSGISDFTYLADFPFGKTLLGNVKKTGSKGPFTLVDGHLYDEENTPIARGSLMSALVPNEALAGKPSETDPFSPEDHLNYIFSYPVAFKDPSMVMCDHVLQADLTRGTAITSYTYPATHPCTKGHFPGAPIMMGVMQLVFLEDSCFALKQALNSNISQLRGNATLIKSDGVIVAQIKGFTVDFLPGDRPQPQLTALKKVSFRGIVEPNDLIYLQFDHLDF